MALAPIIRLAEENSTDSKGPQTQTGGRFNLMRYFALTSLVALVGVVLLSALIFGALMRYTLVQEAEADAIAVARLMAGEFNAELDALATGKASPRIPGRHL